MNGFIQWTQSEMGRRVWTWALAGIGFLVEGGVIPLDAAIGPWSVGQILTYLGIFGAATAGSQTRR